MNPANDIAEFLASRRARITPEHVGLTTYGSRRVKGLRRAEVASLDSGLTISVYAAAPGGRSHQSLDLLASWIATPADDLVAADDDNATAPPEA